MEKQHAAGLLLRRLAGDAGRLYDCARSCGTAARSRSTIRTASAPQISDSDLYLHAEGTLYEAYRTLGAHIVERGVAACASRCGRRTPERHRGRRVQRLGHPPPSHAAAQRRRLGNFHSRARRGHAVQVPRALALRRLSSSSRPTRTRSAARCRRNRRRWSGSSTATSGRTRSGWKRAPKRTAESADVDLRSAPGIVAARPAGRC